MAVTPFAAATRVLPPLRVSRAPLSLRLPLQRLSILAALLLLCAFPWMTSTGCAGDLPPTTMTGFALFAKSAHSDGIVWLGPLGLLLSAALGPSLARLRRAPARFAGAVGALLLGVVGGLYTLLGFEVAVAGDVVVRHPAGIVGEALLVLFVVDALVRVVLAGREWWIDRLASAFE